MTPASFDQMLAAALPSDSLYAVGGRVRDEVRSALDGVAREAKDLDYVATGLTLDELLGRLQRLGRADVVGASFAVVKLTIDGTTVDVALPRRERSTGIGHRDFAVKSGPDIPLDDDLGRRDFRMNMLARALPTGSLVDPYGGATDIAARRIDIVRDETFIEDPLRMLRACQFAARFEFEPTERTLDAMRSASDSIASVSPERVRDELWKLLGAAQPSLGFELMRKTGLLERVLPELCEGVGVEQNEYHAYDVYRHNLMTADAAPTQDIELRLAALLHDVGKPRTKRGPHFYRHDLVGETMAVEILERLHAPKSTAQTVGALVRNHMYTAGPELSDYAVRRFVGRIGRERLERQFALRRADVAGSGLPERGDTNARFEQRVATLLATVPPLSVHDLAIGGCEIIAAAVKRGLLAPGSRGGPLVGRVLQRLLEGVLQHPEGNNAAALTEALELILSDGSL